MNWYKTAKTKTVWLTGPLRRTRKGFYYVQVPGTIVSSFMWILPDEGTEHPKDKWDIRIGAHISVIYPDEIKDHEVTELGKEFEYKITGLESVEPDGKAYTVYMLVVDSPQLEALRRKYDLTPKVKGNQNFHITVGVTE